MGIFPGDNLEIFFFLLISTTKETIKDTQYKVLSMLYVTPAVLQRICPTIVSTLVRLVYDFTFDGSSVSALNSVKVQEYIPDDIQEFCHIRPQVAPPSYAM